jgi:hypothetical protein
VKCPNKIQRRKSSSQSTAHDYNWGKCLKKGISPNVFGGGYFGLQYVKSPQFQNKIKNQLMGELKGALPGVVGGQMPKLTSPGIQLPKKSIPSFR